jgi:hypothetical protein
LERKKSSYASRIAANLHQKDTNGTITKSVQKKRPIIEIKLPNKKNKHYVITGNLPQRILST